MLKITDAERSYMNEMRMLTTDSKGNELLVGLNEEESQFYLDFANGRIVERGGDDAQRDRYLELHDKHELARLRVISAEAEARQDQTPRH